MGDNQEYVAVLPTRPGIPPELAPGTGRSAHTPHLQLSGEEVRSSFNISFLYLTSCQTFWFQDPFYTLKNF